jgi:hypothetical protein
MQGSSYETAQLAAQQVLAQAMPQILGTVKSQAVNASPDPMGAMVTRLIEPYLQQMMQQMMGSFMGGFGMPSGMMPGAPGQPQHGQPLGQAGFHSPAPGANQATEDEVKEAFNDI